MTITYTILVRTVSESNCHEHWRGRQRRAKKQREAAKWFTAAEMMKRDCCVGPCCVGPDERISITLTRLTTYPPRMDSDNLAGSMKAVRDGIADALGIDDGDERLTWKYDQQRASEPGVRVEIVTER